MREMDFSTAHPYPPFARGEKDNEIGMNAELVQDRLSIAPG